ncbi:hypothetical protein [Blautia sp.]|uniref:hypothetical protein n=1 Tax=Blautia sp. TaxID=1955243 RepID=UPI00258CE667|nr:hypothetical protein [Blautia sp.]
MRKKIYALFLTGIFLIPLPVQADSSEYIKEKKFSAYSEEENIPEFEPHIEKDGVEYTLSDVEVKTEKKTPIEEIRYISKDIETIVQEGETFEPEKEWKEDGVTYKLVEVQQEKAEGVHAVEQVVSGYTDYTYPVTKDTVPKRKKITVKNAVTGENMEVECDLVDVVANGGGWQPNSIDITFFNVDADQYTWGNITVPGMEGQEIPLAGYEVELLQSVGADSSSRVKSLSWVSEPYTDEEGQICRDARAEIEQYVEYYRANYEKTVKTEKPGTKYIATYEGKQTVKSKTEYKYDRVAKAYYKEVEKSVVPYVVAGIGILLLIVLIVGILFVFSKKRKKEGK